MSKQNLRPKGVCGGAVLQDNRAKNASIAGWQETLRPIGHIVPHLSQVYICPCFTNGGLLFRNRTHQNYKSRVSGYPICQVTRVTHGHVGYCYVLHTSPECLVIYSACQCAQSLLQWHSDPERQELIALLNKETTASCRPLCQ